MWRLLRHSLAGGTWWKRPFGRPNIRWKGNVEPNLNEIVRGCELIWQMIGTGGSLLWTRHETSAFIKCGEFVDWLRNCQLLKNISVAWSYKLMRLWIVWLVSARVTEDVAVFVFLQDVVASVYQTARRHIPADCSHYLSQFSNLFVFHARKVKEIASSPWALKWSLFAIDCSGTVTSGDWSSQWPHVWEGGAGTVTATIDIYIDTNGVRQNGAPYVLWRKNLTHRHTHIYHNRNVSFIPECHS